MPCDAQIKKDGDRKRKEAPWDVEKEREIKIERIRYRERHRGVYKRRDMERAGVREIDREISAVGCTD